MREMQLEAILAAHTPREVVNPIFVPYLEVSVEANGIAFVSNRSIAKLMLNASLMKQLRMEQIEKEMHRCKQ